MEKIFNFVESLPGKKLLFYQNFSQKNQEKFRKITVLDNGWKPSKQFILKDIGHLRELSIIIAYYTPFKFKEENSLNKEIFYKKVYGFCWNGRNFEGIDKHELKNMYQEKIQSDAKIHLDDVIFGEKK